MKHLLASTALVLAMAGGVHAQTETTAQTEAVGLNQVEMLQGDALASDLIGMRIYNSETRLEPNATFAAGDQTNWDDIGEIQDILITENGEVSAVILGVGGFLGIGERDVAVSMNNLTILHDPNDPNERFIVASTTKEELEQLPAFERDQDRMAANPTTDPAVGPASDPAVLNPNNDPAVANDPAVGAPMLTRPMVEREGYTETTMEAVDQLTAEDLDGATVYGANDENVGTVNTLVLDDDGKISEVVVGIGGFLGIGEKSIAVGFDELQILQRTDNANDMRIYIDSTKEALEAQPEYEG